MDIKIFHRFQCDDTVYDNDVVNDDNVVDYDDNDDDYDPTRALYSAGLFSLHRLHHPYITLGGSPA